MKMVNFSNNNYTNTEDTIKHHKMYKTRDNSIKLKALTSALKEENKHIKEVKKVVKKKKKNPNPLKNKA